MDLEKISVIIPVYNRAGVFKKALETLLAQTYTNFEVIIVDDGSEEDIKTVILSFPSLNIKYHRQDNKGAPAARNKGFELSTGQYVIFWDADIGGDPEILEQMYDRLQKHQDASYVYCNYLLANNVEMKSIPFNAEKLKKVNYIHTTSLIRRKDFPVKGFDENLKRFQDWDLWLTMLKNGKHGVHIGNCLFDILSKGSMSDWLPRYAYWWPFRKLPMFKGKVKKYDEAKDVIYAKHGIGK